MCQPKGFEVEGNKHIICKLKKSLSNAKEASSQWFLKLDKVGKSFGFKENFVDQCVYQRSDRVSSLF